jgi:YHYH protein
MRTPHMLRLALLASSVFAAATATAHELPLGDGHVSTQPETGYVDSCQTTFGGGGAFRDGPWITGDTWNPDQKPTVDGEVTWPSQISISVEGDQRVIRSNDLPSYPTGVYPIQPDDDAFAYDRNPNSIRDHDIVLSLPANPQVADSPSCVPMGMIGFTLSGTAIYNALDGQGRDAAAHEIQDACDGHPQRSGQYHYHSYSACMNDTRSGPGGASDLLGYALDGFGIYGPYDENGKLVTDADLDACHGRTSEVMWNGNPTDIYHYQFTEEYPYTIGCFTGTPQHVGGNGTVAGGPSHDMQGAGIQAPGMPGMQGLRRPPRGPRPGFPGRRRG